MATITKSDFGQTTEANDVAVAFPQSIHNRTILITGINKDGIGFTTAEAFASQSPHCLILAGRSQAKVQACIDEIISCHPHVNIRLLLVDLSSQKSVRAAAAEVLSSKDVPTIDLVVNSAGIMRHGEKFDGEMPVSEDGIEQMFAINHLGHYLLTNLIMPKIIAASHGSVPGSTRVINVSSTGAYVSPFRPSDLGWKQPASKLPETERPNFAMMRQAKMDVDEDVPYIPTAAYGHSKTCNILFSVGLNDRLYTKYGILSLALHPGEIRTELARNTDPDWLNRAIKQREERGIMHWKTQRQGASTTLVAACDPGLNVRDPEVQYLSDCHVGKPPPWAVDVAQAHKLWAISEELTGQKFDL